MAGTAVRRRLGTPWRAGRLAWSRAETATSRTLRLVVPGWPGHLPGQHVDIRLTAEDGYTAQRSYSMAAPASGDDVEVTVQLVPDGEVSPFLVRELAEGDEIEVRGPLGGWFVWNATQPEPVLLVAGGSGIVPLMAMIRARREAHATAPFRLLYSVRSPDEVYYADELAHAEDSEVLVVHTRVAPQASGRLPHRLEASELASFAWPVADAPTCYVCGPTPFVESVADLLVQAGHDPGRIRTERFGGSGG